jgi:hypothetical protein
MPSRKSTPYVNDDMPETRQCDRLDNTGIGNERPIPLHQSRGVPGQVNLDSNSWPSSLNTAVPPTAATHMPNISQLVTSPWQNDWAADVFDQTSNAMFSYELPPEICFRSSPDQSFISQPTFVHQTNPWGFTQADVDLEAFSAATGPGFDQETVHTAAPPVTANATIYDQHSDVQSAFDVDESLDVPLLWSDPSVGLRTKCQDHIGQDLFPQDRIAQNSVPQDPLAQNSFAHGDFAYTRAESAPSFPNMDQQMYAQSIRIQILSAEAQSGNTLHILLTMVLIV